MKRLANTFVHPVAAGTVDGETFRQRTMRELLAALLSNPACRDLADVELLDQAERLTDALIRRLEGHRDAPTPTGVSVSCSILEHAYCSQAGCECGCHMEE